MGKITLIKNAKAIVTCDGNDSVFTDSDILIDSNAIVGIGRSLECAPDEIIVWDEKMPGDTLYEFAFDYFGRHPDAYFNTLLVFDKAYIDFYADRMEAAQEKLLSVIPLLDEVKEGYYLKYLVN